jgi:hypothetical protein
MDQQGGSQPGPSEGAGITEEITFAREKGKEPGGCGAATSKPSRTAKKDL